MIKEITATGKDLTLAKENAVAALGAAPDADVSFEILDLGTKGIFGIGARPAKVRAYIELPDAPERHARGERREKPEGGENREKTEGAPRRKGGSRNRRRGGGGGARPAEATRTSTRQAEIEEAVREGKQKGTAIRSVVIPESQLSFERVEVAEGENRPLDFIRRLIADMGLDAEAALYSASDGTLRITVTGEAASVLIGHHGDTLDALQYLANLAGAKKNENGEKSKVRITLDIEGYRAKREETLRALARRKAAQVLEKKKSVMLEPMSAYERRIIHSEVQSIDGVSTNSVGSDTNRKIVIFLTDKHPAEAPAEEEFTVELTSTPDDTAATAADDE